MQLAEKKKMGLDDPFTRYFPDFPFAQITILQLLGQTTGLPDYSLFDSLVAIHPDKVFTNADIIPALRQAGKGLGFAPGESWQYCNMNYCLLALLVEKVSGQTLQQYLEQHIFLPAGMRHTR